MNLPDVNVLVQAFRSDSNDHSRCHAWLDRTVNGERRFAIAPQVLSGVIRVVTHPKVFARPSAPAEVLKFCDILRGRPNCVLVQPGERHWPIFVRLCREADARGNLVADAWLAALAIEWACEWVTLDRDFARFPGLSWMSPA
ncbi:MAG: type II toxin-antitoxin system VapC family toxin [Alphaproteobacteria bacterium]|nr:type II toxin-antitoxin system VapC family toxin [Alphaproteobacteria bacterium]